MLREEATAEASTAERWYGLALGVALDVGRRRDLTLVGAAWLVAGRDVKTGVSRRCGRGPGAAAVTDVESSMGRDAVDRPWRCLAASGTIRDNVESWWEPTVTQSAESLDDQAGERERAVRFWTRVVNDLDLEPAGADAFKDIGGRLRRLLRPAAVTDFKDLTIADGAARSQVVFNWPIRVRWSFDDETGARR